MARVRVVALAQQGLEEDMIRSDGGPTLQVLAIRHVSEYIHRADQLPRFGEIVQDRVVEVFVAHVANGEHLVDDVVHFFVHFGGSELPDGGVVSAALVFEPGLLRGPVEEVETH